MAVTDLTGYTWVGNDTLTLSTFSYNLSFVDENSRGWGWFEAIFNQNIMGMALYYDSYSPVYNAYEGWDDSAYKTILITGGTDATNADLIAWLQANGTLTPPPSPSIADKLQDLIDIKQDIKEAIENKDVDLTGVDFGGYAEKIDLLPAVVELTQEEYDELESYDDNTYYLIVEEE